MENKIEPAFNDLRGVTDALVKSLFNLHIGRTFNHTKPEEERIDIPKEEFLHLVSLAQAYSKRRRLEVD